MKGTRSSSACWSQLGHSSKSGPLDGRADAAISLLGMSNIFEAERFMNSLLAEPNIQALDQALAVLDADDLRAIVRRLILDIGPVNH